jgi:hypothetical protein
MLLFSLIALKNFDDYVMLLNQMANTMLKEVRFTMLCVAFKLIK